MKRATTVSATSASDPTAPDCILGLDVSKNTLDVVLRTPGGAHQRKSVSNDPDGFDALLQWLERETNSMGRIHSCLEASGGYEQPVARFLYGHGARVSVVNPRRLFGYANSQLRRSKTDRADAQLLARFCEREQPGPWEPPDPDREALQQFSRGLQSLKKERDRLKNQIDRTGSEPVADAFTSVLEEVNEQIETLQGQLDEKIEASRPLRRERGLLETIPGVGRTAATQILAELGDPTRFEHARQAAAYAGLTPSHYRSGTSVRKEPRLSKIGNARLRKAMYFPAITALRCNAAIEAFGQRLAERGKVRMVIVGAAMRKLLHICYGVLKNDKPFDASLHPGVT